MSLLKRTREQFIRYILRSCSRIYSKGYSLIRLSKNGQNHCGERFSAAGGAEKSAAGGKFAGLGAIFKVSIVL
jgi:hypothetical protein